MTEKSDAFHERGIHAPKRPTAIELFRKKEREGGLTPEEEGEMQGLFAHPDNPEAADLRKKEYLASEGIGTMTEDERERLRAIREEKYVYEQAGTSKDRQQYVYKQAGTSKDRQQEADIVELKTLYLQAMIASREGRWKGEPKEVIDRMIATIPESITIYTQEDLHLMPRNDPSELELYFLSKIRNLPDFRSDEKPEGALWVMESIRCLRDAIRTKKFLAGLSESINDLDSGEKERIEMCDAGTGAIPILAIYAALSSRKIHCTALELNPNSARIAQKVVEAFGLQDRVKILQQDATKFIPHQSFDLLVSETMHSGLTAEPLVQILTNLKKHVREGGVTLPTEVRVKATLVPLEDCTSPKGFVKIYDAMHHVVLSKWKDVAKYKPGEELAEIAFDISTEGVKAGMYFVFVASEVDIGSQTIDLYQSLITMPQVLTDDRSDPEIFDIDKDLRRGMIKVRYKPGERLDGVGKFS